MIPLKSGLRTWIKDWSQKKKIKMTKKYLGAIPLLSTCLKYSTSYSTDLCLAMFILFLFTVARKEKLMNE